MSQLEDKKEGHYCHRYDKQNVTSIRHNFDEADKLRIDKVEEIWEHHALHRAMEEDTVSAIENVTILLVTYYRNRNISNG